MSTHRVTLSSLLYDFYIKLSKHITERNIAKRKFFTLLSHLGEDRFDLKKTRPLHYPSRYHISSLSRCRTRVDTQGLDDMM